MVSENKTRAMDQKIFSMELSVEAVSLYLLCCGLIDQDATVSSKNIANTWNSTPKALLQAHADLEKGGIIKKILSDKKGNDIFRVMDSDQWK